MEKSANKLWRESGTTLSFKEWINRENEKKQNSLSFLGEDIVKDTLSNENLNRNYNREETNTSSVLGLNKGVLIFSSLLIVGSIGYYFFNRLKNKK